LKQFEEKMCFSRIIEVQATPTPPTATLPTGQPETAASICFEDETLTNQHTTLPTKPRRQKRNGQRETAPLRRQNNRRQTGAPALTRQREIRYAVTTDTSAISTTA
jgi:hypothetical protein